MKSDPRLDETGMREEAAQHTAQHLLSATILRLFGKPTVSMHLGSDFNTIDVDAAELSADELSEAEAAVYDIIEADYPVVAHLCPPENVADFPLRKKPPEDEEIIRIIEIDGYDYSPCSGVHLPSTGLIGMLKIIGAEKYKGMVRVSFVAGRKAFRDYRAVRAAAEKAAAPLKVPVAEIGAAVLSLADRAAALDRSLLNARESLAAHEAARLVASSAGKTIAECWADRSMDEVLRVGRAAQKSTEAVIVVASAADLKAAVLTARKDADLRGTVKGLMEAHGGKGGGGPSFMQAAFTSKGQLDGFMAAAKAAYGAAPR